MGKGGGSKLDQTCLVLVRPFSIITRILQNIFQTNFWFARLLPMVRISAILDYIWGSKGPNTSQKRPLDTEPVSKILKIFNLRTTNAMLVKLTTIMYLHESVNRKALRARNLVWGEYSIKDHPK